MIAVFLSVDLFEKFKELVKKDLFSEEDMRQVSTAENGVISFFTPFTTYDRVCNLTPKHTFEDGLTKLIEAILRSEQ